MRTIVRFGGLLAAVTCVALVSAAAKDAAPKNALIEAYMPEPMPAGFQVENTDTQGPVFADSHGQTLYMWPSVPLRNGKVGEDPGKSSCNNERITMSDGLYSIYGPALLPEVDKRPTCTAVWPPALAPADAKPVGKWTLLPRQDGSKQWAYAGYALYTSILDHRPGDVDGGERTTPKRNLTVGEPMREAVAPAPLVPPGFTVTSTPVGRLLTTDKGFTVYTSAKDTAVKSNCDAACQEAWHPIIASDFAQPQGEWTTIERAPGLKQWAFRNKPVYTYSLDRSIHGLDGEEVAGWHATYTQLAPSPPAEFTFQNTLAGEVLADHSGKTIYTYSCYEDALDQLSCDTPDTSQVYRMAICGVGDAATCLHDWPPVRAPQNAVITSKVWGVAYIDPKTGHRAAESQPDAWRVWTYRGRPIYTYAGDKAPGDISGDEFGEHDQNRNVFKAFYMRSIGRYQ